MAMSKEDIEKKSPSPKGSPGPTMPSFVLPLPLSNCNTPVKDSTLSLCVQCGYLKNGGV